jgi:ribonucleotide monophosphatase NagD (HAD superfamily)
MNEIFNKVFNGADLVAMHKNKYWNPSGKLEIDAGAFVAGIEFATSKEAILLGKPSEHFFKTALDKINADPDGEFFMVGDDLENDVKGAQDLGGMGILIYTGKTEAPLDKSLGIKPDYETNSLQTVIDILSKEII